MVLELFCDIFDVLCGEVVLPSVLGLVVREVQFQGGSVDVDF